MAMLSVDRLGEALYEQVVTQSSLCDVSVTAGNQLVRAHWCVLVTCPYFEALYNSHLVERGSGYIELSISAAGLIDAIKFLYKGHCDITSDNVESLLVTADYLQIASLIYCCENYLSTVPISVDNCITTCLLAGTYNLDNLYKAAVSFLKKHLSKVLLTDRILQLDFESIRSIMNMTQVDMIEEAVLFGFITRWTQHDPSSRSPMFPILFDLLKLDRLSPRTFYDEVRHNKFVNAFPECVAKIDDLDVMVEKGYVKLEPEYRTVFITIGSESGVYNSSHELMRRILIHDPWRNVWINLAPLSFTFSGSKALITNKGNVIYITKEKMLGKYERFINVQTYDFVHNRPGKMDIRVPYYTNDCDLKVKFIYACDSMLYIGAVYNSFSEYKFALFSHSPTAEYDGMVRECELYVGQGCVEVVTVTIVKVKRLCIVTKLYAHNCEPTTTVYLYDFFTCGIQRISTNNTFPASALTFFKDDDLVIVSPGTAYYYMLSMDDLSWRHDGSMHVPQLPDSYFGSTYSCQYLEGYIYVYDITVGDANNDVCKLKLGEHVWICGDTARSAPANVGTDLIPLYVSSLILRSIKNNVQLGGVEVF